MVFYVRYNVDFRMHLSGCECYAAQTPLYVAVVRLLLSITGRLGVLLLIFYITLCSADAQKHKTWVAAYLEIFEKLRDYIKQHHTTGPSWNSKVF